MTKMKTLVIILVIIISCLNDTVAQPYEWTVKPGTSEWSKLNTHSGMIATLQIPVNVLKNISTKDLTETCLKYPLLFEIWAYESFQNGLDQIVKNFNGLQELMLRTDAGMELLKKYQEINLIDIEKNPDGVEKARLKLEVCKIEALLSHQTIMMNMNRSDKLVLLKGLLNKTKILISSKNNPSYCFDSNLIVIVRLLMSEDHDILNLKSNGNKNLIHFIKQGCNVSSKSIDDVLEIANIYLSNNN
jgi:hypothetical protein